MEFRAAGRPGEHDRPWVPNRHDLVLGLSRHLPRYLYDVDTYMLGAAIVFGDSIRFVCVSVM